VDAQEAMKRFFLILHRYIKYKTSCRNSDWFETWILRQIPLGNSNHRNVDNNDTLRAGYKDNRPEYFFGGGTDHLRKFAVAGVIAFLFGAP
jgi:hypothetical protein